MVWTSRKMLRRIVSLFGLPLEADELDVDHVEMLAGFGQKLAQQIVHLDSNPTHATQTACAESFARMGL